MSKPRESVKDEKCVSLLVIVIDTNPSQRILRQNAQNLDQLVDSVAAFANAHLLQKTQNRLIVMSCHHTGTEIVFPLVTEELETRDNDGQYEVFSHVEHCVKERISKIINNAPKLSTPCESRLGGSLLKALCHIARMKRIYKYMDLQSRILVVSGSNECVSQYIIYMNAFTSAQKLGIVIDLCALDKPLSLLQQGCDITGGQCVRINQFESLLQYLLWVFLPDPRMRHKIVLPPPAKVDYRAACFCHRELIDIGFVCSVCLSIFCKYSPICTTCHTVFAVQLPKHIAQKKKKKKIN